MAKPNVGDLIPLVTEKEFNEHKTKKATQDEYGHIKLSDIPKPHLTDSTTNNKYKWGIENGLIFLEKVVE